MMRILVVIFCLFGIVSPAVGEDRFNCAFPLFALRNVDPHDAKIAAKHLIKQIVEGQGYIYKTEVPEDPATFVEELREGRYDFFLIFTTDYLRLKDTIAMTPVLSGMRGRKGPLESFLLLASDEKEGGLEELEGGELLIEGGSGELPKLWLDDVLSSKGLSPAKDLFSESEEVTSVSKAALPVFFGKAEACIVTEAAFETLTELNPQLRRKLRVVARSEPLATSILCVRDGFVEKREGQIVSVGSDLHNKPQGRQILTLMRVNQLVPFEEHFLDATAAIMARQLPTGGGVLAGEGSTEE